MTRVWCDECKEEIKEVVYVLQGKGIDSAYKGGKFHLHHACIKKWGTKS